jgi:PAS domain S-box-containing protein
MIVVCPLTSLVLGATLLGGAKSGTHVAQTDASAPTSYQARRIFRRVNREIRETTMISSALVGFVALVVIGVTIAGRSTRSRLEQKGQQRLVETTPQIVWITDASGALEYLGDRWFQYTGQDPSTVFAYDWSAFVHPDDVSKTKATWQRSLRTGLAYEAEFRLRNAGGEYHRFIDRGMPDRDSEGKIERWVGACMDIDPAHVQMSFSNVCVQLGERAASRPWDS